MSFRKAIVVTALFLTSTLAPSQQATPDLSGGLQPYGSYQGSDLDDVNLQNGNLLIQIPLVSYPQRGNKLKMDYALIYNGKPVGNHKLCVVILGKTQCNYFWGAGASLGALGPGWQIVDLQNVLPSNLEYSIPYGTGKLYFIAVQWQTSDSSIHVGAAIQGTKTGQVATDGSAFFTGVQDVPQTTGYSNPCSAECYTIGPDGVVYGPGSNVLRQDPDGNQITVTSQSGDLIEPYTDTMGRNIPGLPIPSSSTNSSACTASNLPALEYAVAAASVWAVPGVSGGTMTYTFCYAQVPVNLPAINGGTGLSKTYEALERVVLPNGQAWTFSYGSTDQNNPTCTYQGSPCNFGDLNQVTLPTGGTIKYQYELLQYTGLVSGTAASTSVVSRTTNANDGQGDHVWTYSWPSVNGVPGATPGTWGSWIATVTDPNGSQTTHAFTDLGLSNSSGLATLYENSTKIYSGTAQGTPLKTVSTQYQNLTNLTGNIYYEFPVSNAAPTTVTVTLDNGQTSSQSFQYCCNFTINSSGLTGLGTGTASYQFLSDVKQYDFGPSSPGALLQEKTASYLFQTNNTYLINNFLNLKSSESVLDGQGNVASQTTFTYDEPSYLTHYSSSITGLGTPVQPVRGHQTTTTTWLNTGTSPQYHTNWYDIGVPYQNLDPLSHAITYSYSSTYEGALLTELTNALNQSSTFTFDFNTGQGLTATDPDGQKITYAYNDSLGRLTSVTYPDQGQTSIQYNDSGNLGVIVTQKVTSSLNKQVQEIVDGFGRQYESILNSDPSGPTYAYNTYDSLGRIYQVWNPTRCNPPTSNCGESTWGVTTYHYDTLGRQTMMIPPDGSPSADNATTSYTGNTVKVTDEAGTYRISTSDALGRLTQVSEGSAAYITVYNYDALSNLLCVEQHGGVTGTGCSSAPSNDSTSQWRVRRFTYDSLSRLLTVKYPETGTITYGYNLDSVLTSKTDNRGIAITYSPDALHRIAQKSYSDSEPTITYTYDAFASGTNFGIGRRTGMTDGSGSTSWTYDQMGREWSETKTIDSITKTQSNLYYFDGSDEQITYPAESAQQGGHSVILSIVPDGSGTNTSGRILSVTDTTNNISYATSLLYGPTGALSSGIFGHSSSYSGIVTNDSYNNRDQPLTRQACGLSSCTGSSYLLNLTYSFGLGINDNGNVQGLSNGKNAARSQSFQYDGINRLAQATSGTTWGIAFTYDPWGNLFQTNTVSGTGTNPMSVNQSVNQVNGGSANQFTLNGYGYDLAGNVLADGFHNTSCSGNNAYAWNAEEQMTCAYGAGYVYDGDGLRVMKNGGASTPTLYWDTLAESDLSGNVTSEYIFLNGERIARRDVSTGSVYYYFKDMLGSSSVVATSAGSLANESDFYPFGGESVITQNLSNQKFKFTGKERDPETGNDSSWARMFTDLTGRWFAPDPAGLALANLTNPQTLNLYAYVGNNPIRYVDPWGLSEDASAEDPDPPTAPSATCGKVAAFFGLCPKLDLPPLEGDSDNSDGPNGSAGFFWMWQSHTGGITQHNTSVTAQLYARPTGAPIPKFHTFWIISGQDQFYILTGGPNAGKITGWVDHAITHADIMKLGWKDAPNDAIRNQQTMLLETEHVAKRFGTYGGLKTLVDRFNTTIGTRGYFYLGPNSNTFSKTMGQWMGVGTTLDPSILPNVTGWDWNP